MTTRAPFLLSMTALLLTACAMALGAPDRGGPPAPSVAGEAGTLPLSCALLATPQGGGVRLEARLTAREALSATYELRVRGAGVSVDQGGELALAARESALLGEATLSAPLSALEAELTVTSGGRRYACPLRQP